MIMQSLLANRPRDTNYKQLYDYFIACETTGQAPKVTRIMEILERSETTVYTRIRRHWNEFISRNDQQQGVEY